MRITDIPTARLRRIAAATARTVGADAPEVRAMRRELHRRAAMGRPAREAVAHAR